MFKFFAVTVLLVSVCGYQLNYHCGNGEKVPIDNISINIECDGVKQCKDGSDETKTYCSPTTGIDDSGNCPYINPYADNVRHPDSDDVCESGVSGWKGGSGCSCRFFVKDTDAQGCPTKFYALCTFSGHSPPNKELTQSDKPKQESKSKPKPSPGIMDESVPEPLPPHPNKFPPPPGTRCSDAHEAIMYEIKERRVGGYNVPSCSKDGNYEPVQCQFWPVHTCWCVNPISGEEIDGTKKVGASQTEMKCTQIGPTRQRYSYTFDYSSYYFNYKCADGRIISLTPVSYQVICNGIQNCADGSDELNCGTPGITSMSQCKWYSSLLTAVLVVLVVLVILLIRVILWW